MPVSNPGPLGILSGVLQGLQARRARGDLLTKNAADLDLRNRQLASEDQARQGTEAHNRGTLDMLGQQLAMQRQSQADAEAKAQAAADMDAARRKTMADLVRDPQNPNLLSAAQGAGWKPSEIKAELDAFRPPPKAEPELTPYQAAELQIRRQELANAKHPHLTKVDDTDPQTGLPRQRFLDEDTRQFVDIKDLTGKPQSAAAGGGGNPLIKGRMAMSSADVQQAIAKMEAFEGKVLSGEKTISPMKQGLAAAAEARPDPNAKGALGLIGNFVAAAGAGKAGQMMSANDPDYAEYERLSRQVGLALTEMLPRPNQEILHMERGLSGIDAGWNPGILQEAQQRRRNALEFVLKNPAVMGNTLPTSKGTSGVQSKPGDFSHLIPPKKQQPSPPPDEPQSPDDAPTTLSASLPRKKGKTARSRAEYDPETGQYLGSTLEFT